MLRQPAGESSCNTCKLWLRRPLGALSQDAVCIVLPNDCANKVKQCLTRGSQPAGGKPIKVIHATISIMLVRWLFPQSISHHAAARPCLVYGSIYVRPVSQRQDAHSICLLCVRHLCMLCVPMTGPQQANQSGVLEDSCDM